jgi:hypothetical protein
MAFFLFSYQVHEKSILFPLLPAAVLFFSEDAGVAVWMSIVGTFR